MGCSARLPGRAGKRSPVTVSVLGCCGGSSANPGGARGSNRPRVEPGPPRLRPPGAPVAGGQPAIPRRGACMPRESPVCSSPPTGLVPVLTPACALGSAQPRQPVGRRATPLLRAAERISGLGLPAWQASALECARKFARFVRAALCCSLGPPGVVPRSPKLPRRSLGRGFEGRSFFGGAVPQTRLPS